MAGETKRTYAVKELDAGSKKLEEGPAREQYREKRQRDSPEHYPNGTVEPRVTGNGPKFVDKDRESSQQREAVIRPQQAGKIDFKSFQNRPKFSSDRTWQGGKGSPQSPSGKSRNRDKGKKSSKSDRGNPQQLYRLSITNPRSNNPTIGIAYPQQKVSPPKKLDAGRAPVSGSYRFHVPSIPEREAELQQEERSYSRCFPEGPSNNLTTSSYTSQAVVGSAGGTQAPQHTPSTLQQQQQHQQHQQQQAQQPPQAAGPLDTSGAQPSGPMLFPDFQLNGADTWQSPDRTLTSTAYGIAAPKTNMVVEPGKTGFMPMSFQYGFSLLDDTATDPFPCDPNPSSQDYMDAALAPPSQVPHNPFQSFQTSTEAQEGVQGTSQFNSEQTEDRPPYPLTAQPQPYMQVPHGPPSSMHCPRGMGEEPEHGESSISVSEQSKGTLADKPDGNAISTGGKRGCHSKDGNGTTGNQRVHMQSNVHHIRNIAQGSGSQMHFPGKAYSSPPLNAVHMGPVPHDKSMGKSHSRLPPSWDGQNKPFPPLEQNSGAYSNLPEKYPYQCQPAHEQRQGPGKNNRMPWQQQLRLTSAMPSQNRIELSRELSNQKLTFVIGATEWQDEEKLHKAGPLKSPGPFQNKRATEGYQRPEGVKQGCSTGMPPCPYKSKPETSHVQACDSKNKSLYYGMNQPIPGASTRTCTYPPPMQVPPMGMMLVSPYESPLPSPTQNPTSSSTCSSLSPASTSPVNSSSDDSQISKPVGPPPFYHQQQGKALTSTDHLNSNHHHFHANASRGLPYPTDRPKEDMMGYLQTNRTHGKSSMESSNFGMEHHPPPPYSAHQLLATSLVTANLDQLDVLLTCKQCDQNFNNLVSFLEHKQYCVQHTFAQNDYKDISKVEDTKKFQIEAPKALTSGPAFPQMSRCPSDLHLSLLGLSKNGELIPDPEPKLDTKDDPLKLNLFSGANNPPASLPDLEMEDAKLDSLITEALNGLGYQSDNAEIDSSFIDAFVDDELTTAKCMSNRQTLKTKDSLMFESRTKHEATASERSYTQGKYLYDSDIDSLSTDSKQTESSNTESQSLEQTDDTNSKEESSPESLRVSSMDKSREHKKWMKETRKSETTLEESSSNPRFVLSKTFSERCGIKSVQESSLYVKSSVPQSLSGNRMSSTQRLVAREGKRRRTGGGTWSKELIHKIVQQKNKLHKLHVKGTKNMQFSLVMERLTPTVQTPTFREYDYVSDSDEDCEPLKIASQGRLSQSIRCKYTYTKECKGRARSEKSRDLPWKQDKNHCFESKKADDVPLSPVKERLRRRSSRSSTSSELSTSVSMSSDSISSPKSLDRTTDSDSERKVEVKRKDSDSFEPNGMGMERSPHRVRRESNTSLALSFSKNTKRYSTEKILLSANKEDSTTTKCSSSSSRNTEIVSELKTRSVISLTRFKSTEVSAVAKEDVFSCETGIIARKEESTCHTKESHKSSSKHYSSELLSNKESSSYSKHKKDDSSTKVKTSHKRKDDNVSDVTLQLSETPAIEFDKLTDAAHDTKDPTSYQTDLVPKPPSLCSVLMDEVCLSPVSTELQDAAAQKDSMRHSLMPCPLEQDQSLLKSPLSFDTSSMFADLPVGAFDNNLYPDIQLNKDSFSPLEPSSEKKDMFESSFSPFLEQRDWGLMVDVTPELPDEIAQYKDDSDAGSEKKSNFSTVPFTLPDKIMNYSTGMSNCPSEDELEIKRIVTELESQLQTNKLGTPPLLDQELPKQLTMIKFSPLRLDQEVDNDQSGLEVDCGGDSLALTAPSMPTDPHSEGFPEPEMPWASPLQFGLVESQHCLHTPTHTITHTHDTLSDKVSASDDMSCAVTDKEHCPGIPHQLDGGTDIKSPHADKSEEMLENEMYTENLMKSLEVISDSIFKKDPLPLPLQESKLLHSSPEHSQIDCQDTNKDLMENETISEEAEERGAEMQSEMLFASANPLSVGCEMSEEGDTAKSNTLTENSVTQNNAVDTEHSQEELFHGLASPLHNPENPEEVSEHPQCEALKRHNESSESQELLFPTTIQYEAEQSKDSNWDCKQLDQEAVEIDSELQAEQRGTKEEEEESKHSELPEPCHGDESVREAEKGDEECVGESILMDVNLKESESVSQDEAKSPAIPTCSTSNDDASSESQKMVDDHCSAEIIETAAAGSPCIVSPLINTTEHFSPTHPSYAGLNKDIDGVTSEVITSELPEKIIEETEYREPLIEPTLTMVTSPLTPVCTDDTQEDEDESKHLAMPPLSPCLPASPHESTSLQMEDAELKTKWNNSSEPTLATEEQSNVQCIENTLVPEALTAEVVADASLDNSCIPQLDYEVTKCEMSISNTLVSSSLISVNSTLSVPSETETLPNKDSVYDFKLSPLNYKEISDNQEEFPYNFTSLQVEKEVDDYTNIKASPKSDCDNQSKNDVLLSSDELSAVHASPEVKTSVDSSKDDALGVSAETLKQSPIQDIVKCSYSDVTSHQKLECISINKLQLHKMENCHVALETNDFMDLHLSLLKKSSGESFDTLAIPTEDISFSLRERDAAPGDEKASQSQEESTAEISFTSAVSASQTEKNVDGFHVKQHTEAKSSPKKNSALHAGQGSFQCEICSMFLRTLPGLKRHKAMKHVVKTNVNSASTSGTTSNNTPVHQTPVSLHKDVQPLQNLHSLQTQPDGISLTLEEPALMLESSVGEPDVPAEPDDEEKKKQPSVEKERKNVKACNNKNSEVSGGSFPLNIVKPDPFSEELLTMLETDILHSIPPDFPPVSQQECYPFSEKTDTANNHQEPEVTSIDKHALESGIAEYKFTASPSEPLDIQKQDHVASESDSQHDGLKTSIASEEQGTSVIGTDFNMIGEPSCNMNTAQAQPAISVQESMNTDSHHKVDMEIKSEKSSSPADNTDANSCSVKDPPASPPGLEPDLNALLDDESTFSQLFPRNEELKRKKCPRVYGNKKQKIAQAVPAVQDYSSSDMFLERKENHKENKTDKTFVNNISTCEYETISIDDAIMLDMCHKGSMKGSADKGRHSDGKTEDKAEDNPDHGLSTFLSPTDDIIKVPAPLGPTNAVTSIGALVSQDDESCKSELPTPACSVQAVELPSAPCVQENSHFNSIDLQNLNTTFQLPEIQFFEPSKDISLVPSIISEGSEVPQSLPTESEKPAKKPTERRGRKRGEAGQKPKDKQYKCKVCFTWFLTLGELNFHKLSHNPSPPPTCYMCVQRKFSSREQLRDHLREKHAKNKAGVWACGMCLKEISDVWMYNEHLREHATQFARKGQTQSSLLDMPGCFMQETAVKNFITSIMQHQPSSRSSKGESSKSSSKANKKATAVDTVDQEISAVDDSEPTVTKTKISEGSKQHSSFTPVEVLQKAEITPKLEMHPNCKDPSRDCHHCGKQFPKPFKLQRHLVVHSLQKIFICHKCPVSYQEAKDLKDHLKNEHEEVDESDSKHTTLYTCELCADVMHVIKKSFICSTCNYIFSKKEQFDRHMEKHLEGGNKIFKFRGVLRPCKPTSSKDDSFNTPPAKKRKIHPDNLQENSSDSGIASVASCHLAQSADMEVLKTAMAEPATSSDDEQQSETDDTNLKTEDGEEITLHDLGDVSQCQFHIDAAAQTCPAEAIPKTEESDDMSYAESHQDKNKADPEITCVTVTCDVKEEEDLLASPKQPASPVMSTKGDSNTNSGRDCTSKPKQCFSEQSVQDNHKETKDAKSISGDGEFSHTASRSPQSEILNNSQASDVLRNKEQSISYSTSLTKQTREDKAKVQPAAPVKSDTEGKDPPSASGTEQFVTPPPVKEKVSHKAGENHKHSPGTSPRALSSVTVDVSPVHHAKVTPLTPSSSDDKDSAKSLKKRKESKQAHSSQRTSSPVARENLGVDSRVKKKFRPDKAEIPAGLKKPDAPGDYPVLSSVKDDTVSNKIVSKHKAGTLGLHLKRGSLDNYPPKKTEIVRHLHVDFKGKRLGPGRPVHSPTSKVSVPSMTNSLNKSRVKTGVRSVDTHSYRTAESQNNLLSQLFGQKLTSFKIPLRKDTSESIN
ncbi:zinc finger protein 469 [Engraulis encrasicolus]|uniref:zinc finger protein 469 n=1 Tax=Engraulis encrasicolus TaxID=184585 RepID=UPI002FD478DA